MQFREKLKTRREQLKMSQKQIAERLCVTSASISSWENGLRNPSIEILEKWSEILGFDLVQKVSDNNAKHGFSILIHVNTEGVCSIEKN